MNSSLWHTSDEAPEYNTGPWIGITTDGQLVTVDYERNSSLRNAYKWFVREEKNGRVTGRSYTVDIKHWAYFPK